MVLGSESALAFLHGFKVRTRGFRVSNCIFQGFQGRSLWFEEKAVSGVQGYGEKMILFLQLRIVYPTSTGSDKSIKYPVWQLRTPASSVANRCCRCPGCKRRCALCHQLVRPSPRNRRGLPDVRDGQNVYVYIYIYIWVYIYIYMSITFAMTKLDGSDTHFLGTINA